MNQTFHTDPYTIRGIRATDTNGTLGTVLPIGGGVGQDFVNLQITSLANQGFQFRVEIFTSTAFTNSISLLLMGVAYFFVKLMS
jgi:hypothetical protein